MLDYDGTLAPFRIDPEKAVPYAGIAALLDRLVDGGRTRVVIVTGRSLAHGDPPLGMRNPVEFWAGHGRERRKAAGRLTVEPQPERLREALADVERWTRQVESLGARVERKPGSIAFHWRGIPDSSVTAVRDFLVGHWNSSRLTEALRWLEFDGGVELADRTASKGVAIETILAGTPPGTPAAYLGDDVTDEDAFNAIRGRGIGVLVRDTRRQTAADFWLRPPDELRRFFEDWHEAIGCEAR